MPGPPYPPYHTGPALEESFFAYARGRGFAREYIPVFWTAAYLSGQRRVIQPALLSLSPSRRYFTVCQHVQAPQEILPPTRSCFPRADSTKGLLRSPSRSCAAASGTRSRSKPKDVFCSFVGSLTHPMRKEIRDTYREDSGVPLRGVRPVDTGRVGRLGSSCSRASPSGHGSRSARGDSARRASASTKPCSSDPCPCM